MRWRIAVVLVALLAAPLVMAQSLRVVADVPFQFQAGLASQSAGRWEIARIPSIAAPMLQIRDEQSGRTTLAVGNPVYRSGFDPGEAKLVFNRYGDRYYLSEVWGDGVVGVYLTPCREEKALRMAGVKAKRTVTYARLR
ncbi:MAG: hypothetical protein KatS3mg005_3568 [Bryobacteraceae bacterium]|nr:MAG: hypothetical protein KatS3mg005_3568 [Bryobacteraceae bacterium]